MESYGWGSIADTLGYASSENNNLHYLLTFSFASRSSHSLGPRRKTIMNTMMVLPGMMILSVRVSSVASPQGASAFDSTTPSSIHNPVPGSPKSIFSQSIVVHRSALNRGMFRRNFIPPSMFPEAFPVIVLAIISPVVILSAVIAAGGGIAYTIKITSNSFRGRSTLQSLPLSCAPTKSTERQTFSGG